jgi:PAS domain S-box-containing protein
MHTEAGPVVLIVAADVTRRHAAERAVRESEERYRSLMSASASVIWTAAPDAGFIEHQVSWQRFTGQSWDEQQGFGWLEAVHPDDRDRIRTLWQRAAAEGQACTSEGRVWHAASQRYRHFASRGVPLIGADGLIREWVATLTDIDDRKRQEAVLEEHARNMEELNAQLLASKSALEQAVDQLASSNRELDDFAYIASHDLKEPLRGIHNYAAFLLEDYADRVDDDGRQKLETLIRLSHRLNALIDALLNYSRLGRTELAIQPTNLNEVVDDVIDTVHVALNEKGVEIRMPRSLPTVDCDRVWVTELFRNLITNAMKYNDKPDPWIEIGAQHDYDPDSEGSPPTDRDPQPIALYVRDNGIGIPPKHHQAVFRIFKRLHGRDEYGGGSGAGLTIVQKIVARHGGRIWLESRTGHGTTFYFTLRGGHRHAQSRANRETARVAH